jgi:hypothetical protein
VFGHETAGGWTLGKPFTWPEERSRVSEEAFCVEEHRDINLPLASIIHGAISTGRDYGEF